MPAVRPSDPLALKLEALSVLDGLNAQHAATEPLSPEARKAQLLSLVQEAAVQQGRAYSLETLTQAVDQWVEGTALVPVSPPSALARSATAAQQHIQRGWRGLVQGWRTSSGLRTLVWGMGGSVLAGLALWLVPWGRVLQAPFALAATHGWLYLGALLAVLGGLVTLAKYFSDQGDDEAQEWTVWLLFGIALLGIVGGALSAITSHSDTDLYYLRADMEAKTQAMEMAGTKVSAGASLDDLFKVADALVDQNTHSRLTYVGPYDEATQTLHQEVDLNPLECKALNARPDPAFHVIEVNGRSARDGQLVCPYLWQNHVVVAMKVTAP